MRMSYHSEERESWDGHWETNGLHMLLYNVCAGAGFTSQQRLTLEGERGLNNLLNHQNGAPDQSNFQQALLK